MSTDSPSTVDVAIIGGGIGGMATAVALDQIGITAHVYERSATARVGGGSIAIDVPGLNLLKGWGLEDDFLKHGVILAGVENHKWTGGVVNFFVLPDLAAMGVELEDRSEARRDIFSTLRTDLTATLATKVPATRVHYGKKVVSVTDHGTHAEAVFEDGTTVRAELIVGADGANSTVRRMVTDHEAERTDVIYVQTKTSVDQLPEGMTLDRMRHWEHWLTDEIAVNVLMTPVRGGKQAEFDVGFYGGKRIAEQNGDVPLEEVLPYLGPDYDPFIIDQVKSTLMTPFAWMLWDLPEIDTWITDRVALLGDAAHAMRPTLGQGANQSMHDANVLAKCLSETSDIPAALKQYESIRLPYVGVIQRASREIRPTPSEWQDLAVEDDPLETKGSWAQSTK